MILDANRYRLNIKRIEQLTSDKTEAERLESISMLAIDTKVPIIIVCFYLGELYGMDAALSSQIERLKRFYAVTEVINVKSS